MAIKEVFPNPTVERVVFQARFPNLFAMEKLIGDFQVEIMSVFPQSALVLKRNILIANIRSKTDLDVKEEANELGVGKIWSFKSEEGVELNVQNDSIDVSSTSHKTYDNVGSPTRFRDAIQFAVDRFLAITRIPKLNRIGLRYVDNCPVPEKKTEVYRAYYDTRLPLDHFPIEDALALRVEARVARGEHYLRFLESFEDKEGTPTLTLDFDGYAFDVPAKDYLSVTDELHKLISDEFERIAKEPLWEYMRRGTEGTK